MTFVRQEPNDERSLSCGFTLLELVAVLGIISFLVAAAAVRLRLPVDAARVDAAREYWRLLDQQLRIEARSRQQALVLKVDLDRHRLQVIDRAGDSAPRDRTDGEIFPLELALSNRQQTTGSVEIDFRSDGTSATYALRWAASTEARAWMIFVGRTGQTIDTQSGEDQDVYLQDLQDGNNPH